MAGVVVSPAKVLLYYKGGADMKGRKVFNGLVLATILALSLVVPTFAQSEPVTVTIPEFSTTSIVSMGMTVAGSFFVLLLTLFVLRVTPRFIAFIRRSLGAASG